MKNLSFACVNVKTYNTFLCIILPLIAIALLYKYISQLQNFKVEWLFTFEFLKLMVIIMCYVTPVTYFLSKVYELVTSGEDISRADAIIGFIAACVLIFPFVLIGLVLIAKFNFFLLPAFTAAIVFIYFRSYKLKLPV